jgi:hypothetical protein
MGLSRRRIWWGTGPLRPLPVAQGGEAIGPMDTLIAATALAHGATLVTGNVREFGRVPGLPVVNWHDGRVPNAGGTWHSARPLESDRVTSAHRVRHAYSLPSPSGRSRLSGPSQGPQPWGPWESLVRRTRLAQIRHSRGRGLPASH